MKVGVIGTGAMGTNHVRIYADLRGVDEVFVYDSDPEKVGRLPQAIATPCPSLSDLLKRVDAVSICTPTPTHLETTLTVIEAGIHCLIEKPIAANVTQAYALLNAIEASSVTIGVGHIERFNPIVSEISKLISKPTLISIERLNPSSGRIKDTPIVEDLMIHDIDVVLHAILRRPHTSIAGTNNMNQCVALLQFAPTTTNMPTTTVVLTASRLANKKIRSIYIEDENYTLIGDYMSQELYTYSKPERFKYLDNRYTQENIIEKIQVNKVEPLREELKAFITAAAHGTPFIVTPEQAARNLELCHQISSLP
jgi:predicted dehydrogenase